MPPSLRPEHILATMLSSTEDAVLSFSLDGTIQSWSRGAEQLYGYAAEEITGRTLTVLLPMYEIPACEELLRAAKDGTFACCESTERLRKDGSRIRIALKRAAVRDDSGAIAGIVEVARPEGLHAQNQAADGQLRLLLQQMPTVLWTADENLRITSHWGAGFGPSKNKARDALTGLANYREFIDTLEREVRRAERSHRVFALLLLDLDELKAINDKYGHLVGNRALKRLSEVIKDHSRDTELAARYGGDEFALVLIDADPGMANRIAQRVGRAFREGRERPPLTVSIYPEDGRTAPELLEAADRHLYKRKKSARAQGVTAG